VWAEYLEKSVEDCEYDAAAVARVRSVHDAALGSMGLNVAAGGQLWDAAIAFERRLSCIDPSIDAAAASEAKSKLASLVKRRFSLPLTGMQAAVLALDAPLPPEVQPAYNIALNLLAARARYESQVGSDSPEAWAACV
jgi:hypothetical protein